MVLSKLITPPALDAQAGDEQTDDVDDAADDGFLCDDVCSGLGIYFLITNLIGILQYYMFRQHYTYPTPEATDKKPVPQKQPRASAKS